MRPVRIGVVGVGRFGRLHARTLAGIAEAELVALVVRDPSQRAAIGHELPGVPIWGDLSAALAQSAAEAWVVATQTASHVDLAEQILRAGAAVLVEKPLGLTVAEAQRLAPLVAPDSRNFMVGHILLFAPEFRRLAREAQQRGGLAYVSAERHRPIGVYELFHGESPLRLVMVHDLYLALVLAGGAEPTRMQASLHPRPGGGCDLALARLEWADGLWVALSASYFTPPGMGSDGFDRLEAYGRGWVARMEINPQPLTIWAERAEWPLALAIDDDPAAPSGWLAEELRCFCRVVRGAEPPLGARYEDGLRIMEWLDRLEQSAES
ncbi:MAG: Gfo/Idh/MocA family oxidoreductase [Roseiflexaceae bacterium]|nr:Gfo/Idh/MocA family oxidoreductase [Roseiflexaceae bacterium]